LKHLILDRDWQPDQIKQFKTELRGFEQEKVLDFKYWQMFPPKD
jgi:hypothetical protein